VALGTGIVNGEEEVMEEVEEGGPRRKRRQCPVEEEARQPGAEAGAGPQ
jgi:hypothetical protein